MNNRVTVVTTVLNEKNTIVRLIEALRHQSLQPDEIIIVDGGSVDGTAEVVQGYQKQVLSLQFISKKGCNIAEGRNIGIAQARNEIVAVIDAGCSPEPTWLEKLIKPLEDPKVDVVAGFTTCEANNYLEFYTGILTLPGYVWNPKNFPVYGRSAAFKKAIWKAAGGYPEWLYTGEDTLFAEKLRKIGAVIKFSPDSRVAWRPRKNLWKMAKMFYLYGRGNGRISWGLRQAHHHLRIYIMEAGLLLVNLFYPQFLFLLLALALYFYLSFYRPLVQKTKKFKTGWRTELYVPVIFYIRTLAYTVGFFTGYFEYKFVHDFRKNLERYLGKTHTLANQRY